MPTALQLFNSQTRQKQPFVARDPQRVTLYLCGPTVYNYIHIGNARSPVIFDCLVRLLQQDFSNVVYARNITDIDDKINQAAQAAGESIYSYSERFTAAYLQDMAGLHTQPPSLQPKATEHIQPIIELIQRLLQRGYAYESEQHVLFSVTDMAQYGRLSNRSLQDMLAGARVEVAQYKRHPMDFVLWKPSSAQQPGWPSPWGYGRPGWHIECTAMIQTHLGNSIDIHGGGSDLLFPHHENEWAQGTCCHEQPEAYVNYWLHNGMITLNGEKMSKSLGNVITLRSLLQHYPGELLRYALLSAHYRSTLDWSDSLLAQSRTNLDRFYTALRDTDAIAQDEQLMPTVDLRTHPVTQALYDDLNTPKAIAELHQLVKNLFTTEDSAQRAQLRAIVGNRSLTGAVQSQRAAMVYSQPSGSG